MPSGFHDSCLFDFRCWWFQRELRPCRGQVQTTRCSPPSPSQPSQTPRRPRPRMCQRLVTFYKTKQNTILSHPHHVSLLIHSWRHNFIDCYSPFYWPLFALPFAYNIIKSVFRTGWLRLVIIPSCFWASVCMYAELLSRLICQERVHMRRNQEPDPATVEFVATVFIDLSQTSTFFIHVWVCFCKCFVLQILSNLQNI